MTDAKNTRQGTCSQETALKGDVVCEICQDTGAMDSGGVAPWGEAISRKCWCEGAFSGGAEQQGNSVDSLRLSLVETLGELQLRNKLLVECEQEKLKLRRALEKIATSKYAKEEKPEIFESDDDEALGWFYQEIAEKALKDKK